MSERATASRVMPGSGTPFTARGRAVAYGPPPWRMSGRTLAIWYRLADPDEVRRQVPRSLQMDADPVVRVRFWDMTHDGDAGAAVGGGETVSTRFREAVVAFPVRFGALEGDYPTYMYADEFIYTAFGREAMGWPVRHGTIRMTDPPDLPLAAGTLLSADLERRGQAVMRASLRLTGERVAVDDSVPPSWLALKVIPDVAEPRAAVGQLVATGPSLIRRGEVWEATATLEMHEGLSDELHFLKPREIVAAQYWVGVELTVDHGRVLAELGDGAWNDV